MLRFSPAALADLQQHALACYPSECVALAIGRGNDVTRVVRLDNMADKLHALDPVEYPRTSRDFFAFNEAKAAKLVREAEAQGDAWLALVHSHIDCGAYFSAEDTRYAAPDGQAVYPDLLQVVIDAQPEGLREARSFKWDGATFAPLAIHPEFACTR